MNLLFFCQNLAKRLKMKNKKKLQSLIICIDHGHNFSISKTP